MHLYHAETALQPLTGRRLVDILDVQNQDRVADTLETIRGWTVFKVGLLEVEAVWRAGLYFRDERDGANPPWPAFCFSIPAGDIHSITYDANSDCTIATTYGPLIIRTDDPEPYTECKESDAVRPVEST